MSANGKYGRNDERQYCCHAIDIVAEDICSAVSQLTYIVSHDDVATLHYTHAKQNDEGDGGGTIDLGSQCLSTYLVDKEGNDYLRQRVRHFLTHCWYAYMEEVFHLLPWEWAEIPSVGRPYRACRRSRTEHDLKRQGDDEVRGTQGV